MCWRSRSQLNSIPSSHVYFPVIHLSCLVLSTPAIRREDYFYAAAHHKLGETTGTCCLLAGRQLHTDTVTAKRAPGDPWQPSGLGELVQGHRVQALDPAPASLLPFNQAGTQVGPVLPFPVSRAAVTKPGRAP